MDANAGHLQRGTYLFLGVNSLQEITALKSFNLLILHNTYSAMSIIWTCYLVNTLACFYLNHGSFILSLFDR